MSATHGRPPVRADHIGSLLRPAKLRQAFRDFNAGKLGREEFRRHSGRRDPRHRQAPRGRRPRSRERRRVPTRFVLGPVRRAHGRPGRQAGGVHLSRRPGPCTRLHCAARDRQGPSRAADRGRRSRVRPRPNPSDHEGHVTIAVDPALLPRSAVCRSWRLRNRAEVLRRPRRSLPTGDRCARGRRGPVRAARRGTAGDALRPGRARYGGGRGAGPRLARRALRRRDQSGRRQPSRGPRHRRPHVPRQLQGPVPLRGRL